MPVRYMCIHHGRALWDADCLIKLSITSLLLPSQLLLHRATHHSHTSAEEFARSLFSRTWTTQAAPLFHRASLFHLQVYDVKQGSNLVEKIRLFIRKITGPLHPNVDDNQAQNIKSLSHPFSREKQHLWVNFISFFFFFFYLPLTDTKGSVVQLSVLHAHIFFPSVLECLQRSDNFIGSIFLNIYILLFHTCDDQRQSSSSPTTKQH